MRDPPLRVPTNDLFDFTTHLYHHHHHHHEPRSFHGAHRHNVHTAICLYYAVLHAPCSVLESNTKNLHHTLDVPIFPRPRSVRHSESDCMQLHHHKLGITYSYIFVALTTDLWVTRLDYRTDQNVIGVFVRPAPGEFL